MSVWELFLISDAGEIPKRLHTVWEFLTEICPCSISFVDIDPGIVALYLRTKMNCCRTVRISWPLSVKFRMSMTKYEFSDTHCSVNLTLLKGVRGVLPILSTYFIFGGGEGRSRCGRCSRKFIEF